MKVDVLTITYQHQGQESTLFPTVISNSTEVVLIDCGYEGFLPMIEGEMTRQGIDPSSLTRIIISHDDIDHLGGLKEWKDKYPDLRVCCSEIEAPYVSGQSKSLRLIQAEEHTGRLPEDQKPGALQFQEMLRNIRRIPMDETLPYDAEIGFLPGVRTIHTPGHTPGHSSFYIESQQTIIASDALVIEDGGFEIANPQYTLNLDDAIQSIRKIKKLAPVKIICYHGGVMEGDITQKLDQLLHRYV